MILDYIKMDDFFYWQGNEDDDSYHGLSGCKYSDYSPVSWNYFEWVDELLNDSVRYDNLSDIVVTLVILGMIHPWDYYTRYLTFDKILNTIKFDSRLKSFPYKTLVRFARSLDYARITYEINNVEKLLELDNYSFKIFESGWLRLPSRGYMLYYPVTLNGVSRWNVDLLCGYEDITCLLLACSDTLNDKVLNYLSREVSE